MTAVIEINGETRALSAATVLELLQAEGLDPTGRGLAVAVNGAVVPRRSWPAAALAPGDRVEIVKPFAGG